MIKAYFILLLVVTFFTKELQATEHIISFMQYSSNNFLNAQDSSYNLLQHKIRDTYFSLSYYYSYHNFYIGAGISKVLVSNTNNLSNPNAVFSIDSKNYMEYSLKSKYKFLQFDKISLLIGFDIGFGYQNKYIAGNYNTVKTLQETIIVDKEIYAEKDVLYSPTAPDEDFFHNLCPANEENLFNIVEWSAKHNGTQYVINIYNNFTCSSYETKAYNVVENKNIPSSKISYQSTFISANLSLSYEINKYLELGVISSITNYQIFKLEQFYNDEISLNIAFSPMSFNIGYYLNFKLPV